MVASEKARSTNLNCEVVAMVKHDQSEPLVDVTYCESHSNSIVSGALQKGSYPEVPCICCDVL